MSTTLYNVNLPLTDSHINDLIRQSYENLKYNLRSAGLTGQDVMQGNHDVCPDDYIAQQMLPILGELIEIWDEFRPADEKYGADRVIAYYIMSEDWIRTAVIGATRNRLTGITPVSIEIV